MSADLAREAGPVPLFALVRAEARIGLRGAPLRIALLFSALLGWSVGNAGGLGAGLSALAAGDAAATYMALVAVYWLSMMAARDAAVSATAIVLSKPQPTERLVAARFLGGYAQVLLLLVLMFAGAAVSRWVHSGTLAGAHAYLLQYARAAVAVFFASSLAYSLSLMAGTPLAGALAGMYWIVTLAGQEHLAKVYYPYYTQNLASFALLGICLVSLTALLHRRSRRGAARPAMWCGVGAAVGGALGPGLALNAAAHGHDPLMRESPFMAEVSRQDAVMEGRSPGFTLPDQRGRLVSLSDTPGRVFLIAILDPRSEEGVLLLDRLRDLHGRYGSQGVLPVAVCISNDQGAARTVATGERLRYPVLTDWGSHHAPKTADASPIAGAFRLTDTPYLAITDRRRRIRHVLEGIATYDGSVAEESVRARLAEEPE